jgi:hypothetical protein
VKRLEIDFAGHGPASRWAGRALAAVAAAFAFQVALSYSDARSALQANESRIAQGQVRSRAMARSVPAEELAAARETVDRLSMPWSTLFAALESSASEDVALLGIEPDPKAGTVLISGDSKDYLAALAYVLNLSRGGALTGVQLVRHEAKPDDPQAPVSFVVSAAWRAR